VLLDTVEAKATHGRTLETFFLITRCGPSVTVPTKMPQVFIAGSTVRNPSAHCRCLQVIESLSHDVLEDGAPVRLETICSKQHTTKNGLNWLDLGSVDMIETSRDMKKILYSL